MAVIFLDCFKAVCHFEDCLFCCQLTVLCHVVSGTIDHCCHSEGQGSFGFFLCHAACDGLLQDQAAGLLHVFIGEFYLRRVCGGALYTRDDCGFACQHGGFIQVVSGDRGVGLGHGVLTCGQVVEALRVVDLDILVRYFDTFSLVIRVVPGLLICIISKLMAVVFLDCREPVGSHGAVSRLSSVLHLQ